ncbi:MAG: tRNA (adenosine(37)-N6)-threonylcarbamoyltransferase complex ATPase subunit type 1 TsaE [Acidimicrobiia bacterium]
MTPDAASATLRRASPGPGATRRIAASIAGLARPGDVVVLTGELGAGKTTFAQGFAAALGVTQDVVSPTFTLVHVHATGRAGLSFVHADLYRLARTGELEDLGLEEMRREGAILLVEWGEVAGDLLGPALLVTLRHADDADSREVEVARRGDQWASRWDRLSVALAAPDAPGRGG